jgi:Uma2 family endonuclease
MSIQTQSGQEGIPVAPVIPPLRDGDRLTREEFERRYDAVPDLKKAELIEGVVYMPSPVRIDHHASPHAALVAWLGAYWANTAGVRVAANGTVRLDIANEPQPDALMFIEPSRGGRISISDDDYIDGGPELVAEVSASTSNVDLGAKFRVYQRHGVCEYLIWRVNDQAIDWFTLRNGQYERLQATAAGHFHSQVFPGLWLDPAAMVREDLPVVMEVLQQGIADQSHTVFLEELKARRPG